MTIDRKRMGDLHEAFLAELTGGEQTRGSGNQWRNQGDTRDAHWQDFAFCFDGKSTRGKSVTIDLAMIEKITAQAAGERPGLGLRFYPNDRLDGPITDWVAVKAADFGELLHAAREAELLRERIAALDAAPEDGALAGAQESSSPVEPPFSGLPRLPWTVVIQEHVGHVVSNGGFRVGPDGAVTPLDVSSVRVEPTAKGTRLIVNELLVAGDLYIDGVLAARSGA